MILLRSRRLGGRARNPSETAYAGRLDMKHFDAIFVPVGEAETSPPLLDVVFCGWRLFSTEIDPGDVREGIEF